MGRRAIEPGGVGDISPKRVDTRLYRVTVRWRDTDGAYHRTTAEGTSVTDCRNRALTRIDEERAKFAAAREKADRGLTLDEAAELWLAELAAGHGRTKKRRTSTIEQYRATWRSALSPVLGSTYLDELTREQAQDVLLAGLFRRQRGQHNEATGTWVPGDYTLDAKGQRIPLEGRQARSVLYLLLTWAADRGKRRDGINVLEGTEPPARKDPDPRALTDEEADRLIAMADTWARSHHRAKTDLRDFLILARYTGARIGEVLGLTWDRVDLDGGVPTVTIDRTLLEPRGSVALTLGPVKTAGKDLGSAKAVIALHPAAVEVLTERKQAAAGKKRKKTKDGKRLPKPPPFVFATDPYLVAVSHANIRRALRNLVRATDLAWVHPHTFRHTLATRAAEAMGEEAAGALLRHAKGSPVTARHYIQRPDQVLLDPRSLFL